MFAKLMEINLQKSTSIRNGGTLTPKIKKCQANKLGPMFQKKNIIICHKNLSPGPGPQYTHVSHIGEVGVYN